MRSIGLDIGEYSVKIVELVQNKKVISVSQIHEKVLSQNISPHDKELEVIEFVRAFFSSQDFSKARWIMAVRQDKVTTRHKVFPFSDRLKIQKSLSFEMEEEIPFDTDNCVFDAKILQTQGLSAEVLANAVPYDHIEKIISLASNFGIELHVITIEGIAFANLIENWEAPIPAIPEIALDLGDVTQPKKKVHIVLNLGHQKTIFTAYHQNKLIFVRSLFWGADQLIQEIIKKNEISFIEAVHFLKTQGQLLLSKHGTTYDQSQTSNTLVQGLRELVRDLQMSILELQSELNAEVTQLDFTGGPSLLPNLGGYLTQHLEIPCNPISLLQNYSPSLSGLTTAENIFAVEMKYAAAVSIALEGFRKPRNPAINLLKGDFAKQNDQLKVIWQQWGSFIQVGIASLIVLILWTSFRDQFSQILVEKGDEAVKTQAKSVARLPKKQANESGIKKYIKENKKKAADLKLISQVAKMNSALDILKKVSEASPQKDQVKIDLVSFQVKDDQVILSGYANSPKEVSLLTKNLQKVAIGPIVDKPANLATQANRVSFNLSFKTDRGLIK